MGRPDLKFNTGKTAKSLSRTKINLTLYGPYSADRQNKKPA